MQKPEQFTVRTWPETIAGEAGFAYEIRDAERRFRGSGWSAGKKSDALDDAREQIARLQAPATRTAVAQ
jgi:hypothetical protein